MSRAVTEEAGCETDGTVVYTASVTAAGSLDGAAHSENKVEAIPATGHDWGEPEWVWAEDYSTATAIFTCGNDPKEVEEAAAEVVAEENGPFCEETGTVTYTATAVFNNEEYIDEQIVELDPIGHKWGEPEWEWAEDFSTATATFTCGNDPEHTESFEVEATSVTTNPTCEEAGSIVYTATVVFNDEEYTDNQIVKLDPIGHEWGEPEWVWAEDYSTATATFTCANDPEHVEIAEAEVSSETTDPTCVDAGNIVYTATVVFNGEAYSDSRTETLEALGHSYTGWSNDEGSHWHLCTRCGERLDEAAHSSSGAATETQDEHCTVCGYVMTPALGHVHAGHLSYVAAKAATCTVAGNTAYYRCSCGKLFTSATAATEIVDQSRVVVPALGHNYATAWRSDAAGHWHVCTRCGQDGPHTAHSSSGEANLEHDEHCTVCSYVIAARKTETALVEFSDTGSLELPAQSFSRSREEDTAWTVTLPAAPTAEGYCFEGWYCSEDGALHQPGETLSFRYADTHHALISGVWTQIIGAGTYELKAGVRYRFAPGSYRISGDDTLYASDRYFFVSRDGSYTVTEGGRES